MYIVSGGKKRQLNSKATMPKKIAELEILCKVFNTFLMWGYASCLCFKMFNLFDRMPEDFSFV